MSLATPTIADINANIIAQLESSIGQTIPLLPKSFSRVLAKALAAVFVLLYKYAGFTFLQLFVATASFQETTVNGRTLIPLVEWGRLIGVGDPDPATRAELTVTVTVQEEIGNLDAGSLLLRASTGVVYSVVSAVALSGSTVTATIQAVDDDQGNLGAGTIGNLEIGDTLSFANPLPYVAREVTVASVVTTAADAETEAVYRARVVRRFQRRPQGGAYADYQAWGEAVEGILNVYPYSADLPGQVDLYVESSTETDGIPTTDQMNAVAAAVEQNDAGLAERRPVTAGVNVFPIYRTTFDVEVAGLLAPDQTTVEGDIADSLTEYFLSREPYIDGLSALPAKNRITLAAVSGIVDDVVNAAGGSFVTVTLKLNGGSIAAYVLSAGEKSKSNTPTFPAI